MCERQRVVCVISYEWLESEEFGCIREGGREREREREREGLTLSFNVSGQIIYE